MVTSLWFPHKINEMIAKISDTIRKGTDQHPHLSSVLRVYPCTLLYAQITVKRVNKFFRWGPHQGAAQAVSRQMDVSLAQRREELLSMYGVICLSVMFWGHRCLLSTVSVGEVSHDWNQEGSRRCGQLLPREFEPESTC